MKAHLPRALPVILIVALIVAGCSNSNKTPQTAWEIATAPSMSQTAIVPEEAPALFGKVKDIVGNEVTLLIAEGGLSEGGLGAAPIDEEAQERMRALRQDLESGRITREQLREEMQKLGVEAQIRTPDQSIGTQFSEETETFIIPVGTPIVTWQRGDSEAGQVELTAIKKDTILRVWKKDGTVTFVQVMGGGTTMGIRQGAGGDESGPGGVMRPGTGGGPGGPVMIFQ